MQNLTGFLDGTKRIIEGKERKRKDTVTQQQRHKQTEEKKHIVLNVTYKP